MSLGIIAPEFPSKRKTNKGKFERDLLPMSLTHTSRSKEGLTPKKKKTRRVTERVVYRSIYTVLPCLLVDDRVVTCSRVS